VLTAPAAFEAVLEAIKGAGITPSMAEVTMIASTYTRLEGSAVGQMVRLIEALEDQDDVQNVYSNFDVDAKQLEEVAG
jgi:transcriptional/translational regulatory protein YebC/TACO1